MVRGRSGRVGVHAHGNRQNADRRGCAVRGPAHRPDRLLHPPAECLVRTKVSRNAIGRRPMGIPSERCGARDRQPAGEPRRSGAGRRGRDFAESAIA